MLSWTALVAFSVLLLLMLVSRAVGRWLDRRLDDDARRALAEARQPAAVPGSEGLAIKARARRGPVVIGLVLVVACYVVGFGGALVLAVRAEWVDTGSAVGSLGLGLAAAATWLLGFAALSLYAVAGAHRFTFHDRAMFVVTWRGRRRFAWADVHRASLYTFRRSASLVLAFDGRCVVEVQIDDFEEPEALLRAIGRRLPVAIEGAGRRRWK